MRRRTRRRLYAVGMAALVGATSPLWAPPLLARMDVFRVEEVGVVGARYVPPDEVVRRAAVETGASVWDDPGPWERRVAGHPLVREAEVVRAGLHRLEIRVREAEPVALVGTPELVPVDGEGRVLPLDPATGGLDLPILAVDAELEDGRLGPGDGRVLLRTLMRLREAEPAFVGRISELGRMESGDVRIFLTDAGPARRVLLPADGPVAALRRVEMALAHRAGGQVGVADGRFEGQVVLRPGPSSGGEVASADGTGGGAPAATGTARDAGGPHPRTGAPTTAPGEGDR